MSEPSAEELCTIANNMVLASPPGEFMEVVADVRALLPDLSLFNESAPKVFREYNTEQMIQVDSPGKDHKVLITKHGEVADGEYLDPKGGQVVHFDHIKQTVTGSRPLSGELDSSLEPLRAAFERAAFDYCTQHYPHGTATVYGTNGQIIVAISAARFNPNNFWNGRWRSTWTLVPGSAELVAQLKIVVHYYEDGNVQLNTQTELRVPLQEGSPDVTAKNAFASIAKHEQTYQQQLETQYQQMGETTFKALRRALPVTRTKIDWNKIKNYKVGGDLNPGAK
eukprot:TRINITY_DN15713_c0_g1_i1.p1 TRINITY_DN15713_c0_g1~~TRINITY_DN15713_c0_g1_i1.p1  ORF type:complete len:281 (+),score=65.37 TRINITY_DN15713_c0_g1_i1:180-1022(+)